MAHILNLKITTSAAPPEQEWFDLQEGSPAIDTGTDAGVTEDIHGTPRPQGEGVDIGASEKK